MSGPNDIPKRNSPASRPRATAPMRISKYSEGVMLSPARARSSASVGLPWTVRFWLSLSAAGRRRRSTSSRGVARAGPTVAGTILRSRRTRSRLQKKIAMASAAGTAMMTAISWLLNARPLEKGRVRRHDGLQVHALGRKHALAVRVGVLGRRGVVVVVGLERVLQRCVGQEPR